MRHIISILLLITVIFVFAFTSNGAEKTGIHHKVMPKNVWYVCGCNDCNCNTIFEKPGKCICGRELIPMRILKIEGNKSYFCRCSAECTCKLNLEDPVKCTCGKPVKVIDLTGKYVCTCCSVISDKPGKCICGKELEK